MPNYEVSEELANAVEETGWPEVAKALEQSRQLLDATLRGDAATVARMVQDAHIDNASLIKYSDERSTFGRSATAENSMSCVLSIAYYYAHGDYIFHREYQTGTGFADLVLMPRKNTSTPAIIVELKYNDTTDTAIDQIHHGIYDLPVYDLLFDRNGAAPIVNSKFVNSKYNDILLVAVSFDRKTKVHDCRIETWHKES